MLVCFKPTVSTDRCFSSRAQVSGAIWQCLKTFRAVTTQGEVPPASVEWRLGTQLNIPQCTGQQRTVWPLMSIVPRLRSPALEKTQGSETTATSRVQATGRESHGLHDILLLLFFHRWSFVSRLEAVKSLSATHGEREDPLQATKPFKA